MTSAQAAPVGRSARPRLRWVPVLCALVIACQAALVLRFIRTERPSAPAYDVRMTIDAGTYVRQATLMVENHDTLYTPDAQHAVGMQVLTAQIFRLFGFEPLAVKLVNWLAWVVTLVLACAAFTHVLPTATAAWVTTTIVALSLTLQRYCGIVQYEIVACLALTALFWLNARDRGAPAAALSGVIVAVLAIFRAHFVLLLPVLAGSYYLFPSARQARRYGALVLGFVLIALPWNAYYSIRNGAPFFFQTHAGAQARRFLNPNSAGFNYPYPKPAEPSGLRFVAEMPGPYLQLLVRRATYLTGIERDIWWIEPRGSELLRTIVERATARRLNAVLALLLALGGAALAIPKRTRTRGGVLAVGIIAILVVPHAIMNSSTRFMVPAIPLLTLLQVQAILTIKELAAPR